MGTNCPVLVPVKTTGTATGTGFGGKTVILTSFKGILGRLKQAEAESARARARHAYARARA